MSDPSVRRTQVIQGPAGPQGPMGPVGPAGPAGTGGGGSGPTSGTGLAKYVAGVVVAAASLLVNADVDPAAAIAGSKIAPNFGSQNVTTTGSLQIGTTPATSGAVALANAAFITARNAANSANVNIVSVDVTNQVQFGDGVNAVSLIFNSSAGNYFRGTTFNIQDAGASINALLVSGLSAASAFSMIVDTSMTSVLVKQADKTTNSGTGSSLTIQAQNETGTTSIGGALVLQSGTGSSTQGAVVFKSGATTVGSLSQVAGDFIAFGVNPATAGPVRIPNNTNIYARNAANSANLSLVYLDSANQVQFGDVNAATLVFNGGAATYVRGSSFNLQNTPPTVNVWSFGTVGSSSTNITADASQTSVLINQADKATASGTGAVLTLQAQNETGATSTGGELQIGPGTGTTANGKLNLINVITGTTVGAAGGATALPATPTGYANIKINGTAQRIPYYA